MASLKRIAADLGVSYTLVSKVLSGRLGTTGVSPKTRDLILRKARELDYIPNRLAVALKAGRKGAVGIFLHQIGSPGSDGSDRLLRGMAEGLEKSGSRMWLRFFQTDEEFLVACDTRLKNEVDGLIVAGLRPPGFMPKFADLERRNVPVVSLFSDLRNSDRKALTNVEVIPKPRVTWPPGIFWSRAVGGSRVSRPSKVAPPVLCALIVRQKSRTTPGC